MIRTLRRLIGVVIDAVSRDVCVLKQREKTMKKLLFMAGMAIGACGPVFAQELHLDITSIENSITDLKDCLLEGELKNATGNKMLVRLEVFAVLKPEFRVPGIFANMGEHAFVSRPRERLDPDAVAEAKLLTQAASCDEIETMYIYKDCAKLDEAECAIPIVVTGLDDFAVPVIIGPPPPE